jgi:hypothetical protein
MAKKYNSTHNDLQDIHTTKLNIKDRVTRTPIKTGGWTQVFQRDILQKINKLKWNSSHNTIHMKQTLYVYLNSNSITEYIIINIYVKYSRLYKQQIHFFSFATSTTSAVF